MPSKRRSRATSINPANRQAIAPRLDMAMRAPVLLEVPLRAVVPKSMAA